MSYLRSVGRTRDTLKVWTSWSSYPSTDTIRRFKTPRNNLLSSLTLSTGSLSKSFDTVGCKTRKVKVPTTALGPPVSRKLLDRGEIVHY